MKTIHKISTVTKPYTVNFKGWSITVPVGAKVSNQTACGYDDSYRFWVDYKEYAKNMTGFDNSMLHHDLRHYGINVPKEYCQDYPKDN